MRLDCLDLIKIAKNFMNARLGIWLLTIFLIVNLSGCGAQVAHVTIESQSTREPYVQSFPRAYLAESEAGDYDIVLVSEGFAKQQSKGKVLLPTPVNEL